MKRLVLRSAAALLFLAALTFAEDAKEPPVKVYLLVGQSNMQGSAHESTFAVMGDDPASAPLLKVILDKEGKPVVAKNAWVANRTVPSGCPAKTSTMVPG